MRAGRFARGAGAAGVVIAVALLLASCSGGGSGKKQKGGTTGPCSPAITDVAPNVGGTAGGDAVTIITTCFEDDFTQVLPDVYFGADLASATALTARVLTVTTPPHAVAEAVDVRVEARGIVEGAVRPQAFTYSTAPPATCTVLDVNPGQGDAGGGATVTVTGTDFDLAPLPAPTVQFGSGNLAPMVTVLSATSLEVVTPAGPPGFVDIIVTTQTGPCVLPSGYLFSTAAVCNVTGVNPNQGFNDRPTPVIVSGTGFDLPPMPAPTVEFGPGNFGTNVTVISANNLSVTVPGGFPPPGSVDVIVTNLANQCTLPGGFEYLPPPPQPSCSIASVAPVTGPDIGGTAVTILGSGFSTVSRVWVGGVEATPVAFRSPTELGITTPPGTGTADVTVDIGGGITCTLPTAFGYVSCGVTSCNLQRVNPKNADAGDTVTLIGSGFESGAIVFFGNAPDVSQAVVVDESGLPTDLAVIVPPQRTPASTVDVQVINPSGVCCLNAGAFTYGGCFVESVTPAMGTPQGGVNVLIKGTNFGAGIPEVWFGTELSPSVSRLNGDIIATTPPANGQTIVEVKVVTTAGDVCTFCCYEFFAGCNVDAITPSSGGTHGGYTVTITGYGFDTGSVPAPGWTPDVRFGDIIADPNSITVDPTGTILTVDAPPSPIGGVVDVTILNVNPVTTCSTTFTYILPGTGACSITAVVPDEGDINGGETVTIQGDGFDPNSGVLFGIVSAQVTYISPQELRVVTPTPIGQVPVGGRAPVDVVVAPENSDPCVLPDGFTYLTPPCDDGFCAINVVSPASGPAAGGNTVTLTGSSLCNDRGPIRVFFGTAESPSVTFIDDTMITAVVPPAAAGPGPVDVVYVDGTGCGAACFACYTYN